ncbi:MAG: hypothetical protein AAFN79_21115 [Pseudomonadota bacterium]
MRHLAPVLFPAVFAALLASPAAAVSDYEECVNFATLDPERTLVDAQAWLDATGSVAAKHCMAIAQGELGAHRTAANTLSDVANAAGLDDETRIATLIEATRQWRLAGRPEAARSSIDAALRIGTSPDALIERSTLKAADRDWEGAERDLDSALAVAPRDHEALTLRAAARLRLQNAEGARRDALLALEYRPISAAAWYQLGLAEQALGLKDAARRSWLKAIDVAPGGRPASLARGAIQDMDGGG